MTTTFKIYQMDRNTADGFVTTVHWVASQVDGDFVASIRNTAIFTKEDGINYIPFADITEEQAIEWVKTSLGAEYLAAVDVVLANNITDQKAPKVAAGLPWPEPVPEPEPEAIIVSVLDSTNP